MHLHNELIRGLLHNVLGAESVSGRAAVGMETAISSGARAIDNDDDADEEEEQDKARCKMMYESFHQRFGKTSSLWDVWGPMRGKVLGIG